ncbi:MAG: NmrA/HSCARG family protein [Deltaproteobacteria bacterium]|nr:NmrA/HSCARG family protein [Deltaproteobacteria bacterium]
MANTILITGATGHQGGAVLRHLASRGGFRLRAMTRKPEGDAAKKLATLGAEIVKGDYDEPGSVERALEGAWGVFAVQNTWEAGVEKEEEQGKQFAKLAKERGVRHFVYTSVGSAHRSTGIPHFDNKYRVEQTVKAMGFPSHVIIRPVFFMENLLGPWFLQGDKLVTAMDPATKLQMIAVDDIGKFGALAFQQAEKLAGQEIDIAGDSVTMPEAAAAIGRTLGRPITYQRIPIEAVRANSADFAIMLEWFERVGYDADIPTLEARYGIRPRTFEEWLKTIPTESGERSLGG